MFNDLYTYIPEQWRFYINQSDLSLITNRLNRHRLTDVLPSKHQIFEALTLIDPEDVKVVILGYPSPSSDLSSGIAYGIPFEYRFTDIYKRIPHPPIQTSVIDYLYSILNGETDTTLRDAVKRGILLLNYPLTCSPGRKLAHIKYGWSTIIKRIIERLLYRSDSSLLLVAWNEDAYSIYTSIVPDWIPNIDGSRFTSPSHPNVTMIISTGPDKNTTVNEPSNKYHKLASRYPFNNERHRSIIAQTIPHLREAHMFCH